MANSILSFWFPQGIIGGGGGGSFNGVILAPSSGLNGNGLSTSPLRVDPELIARFVDIPEIPEGVAGDVWGWSALGVPQAEKTGGPGQLARLGADGSLSVIAGTTENSAVTKAQLDAALGQITALTEALNAAQDAMALMVTQLQDLDNTLVQQNAAIGALQSDLAALTPRVADLETDMPAIQAFDTDAEAADFSNARPGNIAFTRGTVA